MSLKTCYKIFAFFIFSISIVLGQESKPTTIADVNNMDSLLARSKELILSYKYEEANTYANKVLLIAREHHDIEKEGDAFYYLANGYLGLQKHWTALDYFNKSFEIKKRLDDKKGLIDILNFQGIICWRLGLSEDALSTLINASKIMEEIEEYSKIIAILNNMGLIHNSIGNEEKALHYYNLALEKCKKFKDLKREASIVNNIGTIYQKKEKYDKALKYFFKSLELKEKQGNKWKIASTLQNIGSIHLSTKNYKEAEKYFKKGLALRKEINNKMGIANSSNDLADLKIKTGNYQKAIVFLNEAIKYGNESNSKPNLKNSYELLAEVYTKTGDYENACMYLKKYSLIKDELINTENTKKIAEMQEKYESDKREKEITLLKKNSIIQQLKYKRNISILIAIILIFIIIILVLHFNYYKNKLRVQSDKEKLESSLKLKADFTAMLVHDLRSPLTAIMGTTDLLKIRTTEKKVLDVADMIKRGSLSMLKLVNEMLDLSKFEAGKMRISKKPYKIDALVRESAQILSALAETNKIEFKVECDPSLPEINIDPTKIDQVVTNILANAIKFSPPNSIITIKSVKMMEKRKKYVEVSIEDNGTGIDPSLKHQVFDKYAQLHDKKAKVGSGLGLAVSKLIIDAHDGEIAFKAAPEKGTIFYFRLPI